ncbi:MAG TPA: methyltransferase domain-containing protein [Candidatus Paceibacterota bacterium]|nr:methyltransferase domain-containing protein [Candidatus Paceibacterota bacterium]
MFTNPRENIMRAGVLEGMHVGDFGTGSGAYALEAARVVKDYGRVYAIDVQKNLLVRLRNTLSDQGIAHVDTLHGDLEMPGGSKIGDGILDFAIASNVFFQCMYKTVLLQEIRRTLKPRGRLLLIDWSESFGHLGPHPENVLDSRDARLLCEQGGFSYRKHIPAGAFHYGIIFEKQA